jgi:predicted phage tail protein
MAIDKYVARFYPAGAGTAVKSCAVADTTCTVTGLAAGSYTVKLQAHNAVGWGPASTAGGPVTITGAPGAPAAPAASSAGPGRIAGAWSTPNSNGGEPIDQYQLRVYASGAAAPIKSCTVLVPALTCGVSGLPADTYTTRVRAHNAAGWGPVSPASSGVTITGVPGAPTAVAATSPAAGKVTATWAPPNSDGGKVVDRYVVRVYPQGSNVVAKSCTVTAPTLQCSVTSLAAGTYVVRLQAHNVAGWGALSALSDPVTVA